MTMTRKIFSALTAISLLVAGTIATASDANAGGRHYNYGHGNYYHGHRGGISSGEAAAIGLGAFGFGMLMSQPRIIYTAPQPQVVYAPPPVVYAPAPQPVYVQPQVTVVPQECSKFLPNMDAVDACITGVRDRHAIEQRDLERRAYEHGRGAVYK